MKHDYVIVGGGVAGLCAAIRLCELGASPLVIESGTYPAHKVCGEFIGPSAHQVLKKWDIHPVPIHEVTFHTEKKKYTFPFPTPAGSLSHLQLDPQLAILARTKGSTIYVQAKVEHMEENLVVLASGERIEAKNLIVAIGRFHRAKKMQYRGFKAHYEGLDAKNLEMYLWKNGYMGISPIEGGKFNVAALVKEEFKGHPALEKGKCLFKEWMSVSIPSFGLKNTPKWNNTYFIGDAAGTIPPFTGNGLSLALFSGILAAEHAIAQDVEGYRKAYMQKFSQVIRLGKWLHPLVQSPFFTNRFLQSTPFLYTKVQL